ncbi:MAG: AMP-dependent synthetase/ligase, partial [Acidimicrobiales bacterium]
MTRAELDQRVAGTTVTSRFAETVAAHRDSTALRWRQPGGGFAALTWGGYAEQACRVAGGLAGLGAGPGHRVLLMTRNRPEFHFADIGALLAGATPVSIYNSSPAEQVRYLAAHSRASVAVVEDAAFLERLAKVRADLPALRHIFVIDDPEARAADGVMPFASLLAADPVDLAAAARGATPGDLATVIYTSGTTGPPKGVMLTHANVTWTVESLLARFGEEGTGTGLRTLSYLPMAHIAERIVSHYLAVRWAAEVITCPEPSLLKEYLPAVRPQVFFGVPRIWERMVAGVSAILAADPERKAHFDDGIATAKGLDAARQEGPLTDDQQNLRAFLDMVAFGQLRDQVGLDQCRLAGSAAAPLNPDVLSWVRAVGIPLAEAYGLSEACGPVTFTAERVKIGRVGPALPGIELKVLADGEVCCRGGNVFAGYLDDPERTAEVLDGEGWLHTGDIGEVDPDGYLRIVDRKKDLIVTAGGENVSPANIEAALVAHPLIGQAAVVGDRRPYLCALVVLDAD